MFGDKDIVAVFRRKHVPGVETHAECGNVRPQFGRGRHEVSAFAETAKLRIRQVSLMTVGIAEMKTGFGCMV